MSVEFNKAQRKKAAKMVHQTEQYYLKEISRLREALDRYGRHEPECHYECCDVLCASPKCTCGLDKALKGEP